VILVDGHAAAYLRRGERELLLFLPEAEPSRSRIGREVARMLLHLAATREGRRGMLIAEINGTPATEHPSARLFIEEGFAATAMGIQARTERLRPRGYGSLDLPGPTGAGLHATGIGIAATGDGGGHMAEPRHNKSEETLENTRRILNGTVSERDRVVPRTIRIRRWNAKALRRSATAAMTRRCAVNISNLDPDSAGRVIATTPERNKSRAKSKIKINAGSGGLELGL
jgi:hypothetical protein